ncbi:acyl-[ACP]--phospholipid O-acyltransferase [Campylobacter sp. MIT 21-1685]|uniref:acyl-[ACP]--phospholipid O-acyltransferase n=1 Tax=unclassified Campylobacter TaxID=2593542 RepID=UPI00224B1BD9|nr:MULTISPECIES: acyl-[ACP]--phospholipid O-acyltransferase [unclassified Campylobacter]MCX2683430.1 acyl-[ACP]--phospholipid O-acyltransferase [Campylobacter sp. MIT 21-1684]MCX2751749.1 acyl-[ACP]--phospholipid O-acyltransferase [Campylobacter sp. MIT 21-1682]MCX2807950.1 acyl-[ACP]--phospholipid O-acyltransferase [Campylobacter sp. MIT 21-1685]
MSRMWKIKGFISFVLVAFINAFVDLGHKITIQNTLYKVYDGSELTLLTSIINALILLPFILLFTPSGFLADRFSKNVVMRVSAWFSVALTALITICYFMGWFWVAFGATLLMAVQSAIYSPAKYGFIKDLVGKDMLAWGNGIMQATAIVAILAGMSVFSFFFEIMYNISGLGFLAQKSEILQSIAPLGFILFFCAMIELYLCYRLPTLTKGTQEHFDKKAYLSGSLLKNNLKLLKSHRNIWLSVVGIAVFWSISQLLLATFPTYVKAAFEEHNAFRVQMVIGCSGLGIIFGSIIAGRFSKQYIETGLIPLGAALVCLMSLLLLSFSSLTSYAIVFFLFGMGGALFVIPLNALIQFHAKEGELGKVLAGNNFIQNIGMLGFLGIGTLASLFHLDVVYLFYLCMIVAFCGMIYVVRLLPFSLVRMLVTLAFFQRYRLNVEGFENVPAEGGVLLLGNHISFIDWAMVQLALPRKVYFVMERSYYDRWYIRIFLDRFGVIPVSSAGSKKALESIAAKLAQGHMVCLFPEGSISRHGHLNEFKSGFELAAKHLQPNEAVILPFYIRGLWGSAFSRSHQGFQERRRTFSKRNITIAFGECLEIHSSAQRVKAKVFELSFNAWKSQCESLSTIGKAWVDSAKKWGSEIAIVDSVNGAMSYTKMLVLTIILSTFFRKNITNERNVGIILPASLASSLCNLSLLMAGKTVVNLNFTAGQNAIDAAVESAQIQTIFTSKTFIEKLKHKGVEFEFLSDVKIFYMEDLVSEMRANKFDLALKMVQAVLLPAFILKWLYVKSQKNTNIAAILFSSGSEGKPKGVMLSHLNIMSNILQISDVIHARDGDSMLSSLPPFHAFGLTVTMFMPLLEGMLSVTHPDPTDAVGIAKAIAKNKVSVMCGTSTFLGIYVRNSKVDKLMFDSLRLVVAGAEKLKKDVKEAFVMKFNKEIYEGYGATETTPVASVNLPNEFDVENWSIHRASKEGSVGMPLPGSAIRIVDPNTMQELPVGEDGLILIGGHQVMVGYLNDEQKTQDVIVEIDGIRWYKSGDKGHLDADGFIHIVDRYSRFAKIGGEMVSLGGIEEEIQKIIKKSEIDETLRYVAVAVEDGKKGESVVLLVSGEKDEIQRLESALKEAQIPALFKPSKIFIVESIPTLGSGKIDLKGAKSIAQGLVG